MTKQEKSVHKKRAARRGLVWRNHPSAAFSGAQGQSRGVGRQAARCAITIRGAATAGRDGIEIEADLSGIREERSLPQRSHRLLIHWPGELDEGSMVPVMSNADAAYFYRHWHEHH